MNNDIMTSKDGVDFIKNFEHLYLKKYNNYVGLPIIGYGHNITNENITNITKDDADKLLLHDLNVIEKIIYNVVKVKLAQYQFDSLISWTYSVGIKILCKSTLLKMLNIGDYNDVPDQMKGWNQINGRVSKDLVIRRNAEANLFINGIYKVETKIIEEVDEEIDE